MSRVCRNSSQSAHPFSPSPSIAAPLSAATQVVVIGMFFSFFFFLAPRCSASTEWTPAVAARCPKVEATSGRGHPLCRAAAAVTDESENGDLLPSSLFALKRHWPSWGDIRR